MPVAQVGADIRVGSLQGALSARVGATPTSDYARDWGATASATTAASRFPAATSPILYDRAATPSATPSPTPTPSAPQPQASPSAAPTPSPSPQAPPPAPHVATPQEIAAQRKELETAKVDADLSQDVYNDGANPPDGYHVATQAELSKLGLTPQMLESPGSDFRARVYVNSDTGRTVVAFRGSQSGEDWKNNLQQGVGLHSDYYSRAIDIGQRIARSGQAVTFTGHSLGGGLASAAAVASGDEADTFNAAGLSGSTIKTATAANVAAGQGGRAGHVDAYYNSGDPLSKIQDTNAAGDGILGGLGGGLIGGLLGGPIGAVVGGLLGGGVGAAVGHAPSAYGDRHQLPNIAPPGGETRGPFAAHHLDYITRGLDAELANLPPAH